eukprot:1919437-Pyramimonas_sp.AAC.1
MRRRACVYEGVTCDGQYSLQRNHAEHHVCESCMGVTEDTSDAAFATGQHKGLSYGRAPRNTPNRVDRGRKVKKPRKDPVLFLGWVNDNFTRKEDG